MQFSQSFLGGIIKFLYSLERYFHVVLKTDLNISFSTTQSVVIAKKLECKVISQYLYNIKLLTATEETVCEYKKASTNQISFTHYRWVFQALDRSVNHKMLREAFKIS